MSRLLQIKSSLFANHGQSSRISDAFVATWLANDPGSNVVTRNFAVEPVPHLDGAAFQAFS